jgi:YihY family inner membrane protein
MSTVSFVPETYDLDTDDARQALAEAQIGRLMKDAFTRFRYADGFSFARSVAFQIVLTIIPGVIFFVALAVRMGEGRLRSVIGSLIESLTPGPAGEMFRQALGQGSNAASSGNIVAIVVGGIAMLVAAVTAMSQVQRGASRIYGIEEDRLTFHRYGLATLLAVTTGILLSLAFVAIALGGPVRGAFGDAASQTWAMLRWPVGLIALGLGLAALFKVAPNRKQPGYAWLLTGSVISLLGWVIVSAALSAYLNASGSFGETYGPLAGFIGFMLWAQLTAIAILYGLSFAAQLEAFRAGVESPRDRAHREEGDLDEETVDV